MLPLSRRSFLSTSATLTAGAALAGVTAPARAIEPIARNGQAKFKFSLAAYSYRDLLGGMAPKLTMSDFVSDCAKFNLEGTELTSYYFPKNVTHDYLRTLAQQCFRLGLDVSGTAVGNDFGHPPGENRLKEIASTKQWIDFAAVLGAPVIRIFAGHDQPGSTPAQAHSLMVSGIEECCEYAGKQGIYLALENHGGPTATADGLLSFVRDVNSPWFGVNLDTGNFASADVYGDLAKAAPYAVNVQVKVVVANDKKEKSPTDFKKLATLLREAHYRGYIVLEFEEKGNPREECPKYLNQMREAFA
ncbi:MAG: sugar phosphate isomerase/epimerase [Pirellulaceae bacterium]|nr:sugar phosphate isomerase/epimerase [Pirellulaceae bacterium]